MPLFFAREPEENICKKYLWKNLLYIFNFNLDEECLAHAWYLATDLQMYIFTPLILIPLAMNPVFGWIIACLLLFLSTAANIVTVYVKDYPATQGFFGPAKMPYKDIIVYDRLIYYAAWIRCQIYIMGLLVGWVLQKYKRIRINSLLNLACWALGAAFMLTDIFGLFHYFRGHQLPIFWRAAYSSLSKPAWGLGLTWLIVSCYYGYGGPINQFMSWNIWVPLGRLSYCAYLVHYSIITYVFALEKNPMFFSSIWQILFNYFIPVVAITGVFALLLSAMVEVPVGKLEMLLLKPKAQIKSTNKKTEPSWEIQNGFVKNSDTHF
uniref:Acyltransferase 3 domain-containing protein n=1 Tax=Panagrolaimus davidi TaxID=227884 RepID=A0A914QJH3_9BILA